MAAVRQVAVVVEQIVIPFREEVMELVAEVLAQLVQVMPPMVLRIRVAVAVEVEFRELEVGQRKAAMAEVA